MLKQFVVVNPIVLTIGDIEDFLGDNIGDTEDLYVQLQLNEFSM